MEEAVWTVAKGELAISSFFSFFESKSMDSFSQVAGSQISETQESILMQELEKLHDEKLRLKDNNSKYIAHHPELHLLLDEFVTQILIQRPSDLIRFGHSFFSDKVAKLPQPLNSSGPPPLVIAGPSGVGKGTLIKMLFDKYPSFFGFSVSHTTRAPRPGEEDGVHYNFTTVDAMKVAIAENKFIEHAQVHTNFYGTSYDAVNKIRDEGRICVLDIDIQGVQSVKKSMIECKYIFIAPPTMDDLENRLRGRGTETIDKILIRLENAKKELEYGLEEGNFDAIVVNDSLENAFIRLLSFLEQFYGDFGFVARVEDVNSNKMDGKETDEEDSHTEVKKNESFANEQEDDEEEDET